MPVPRRRLALLAACSTLLAGFALLPAFDPTPVAGEVPAFAAPLGLQAGFIENRGQWDPRVKYSTRTGPVTAFLEERGWTLAMVERDPSTGISSGAGAAVRMHFESSARDVAIAPREALPGRLSYFLGKDPSTWRTDVPSYRAVRYAGMYPGVDVQVREAGRKLEYDLLLAPGADLSGIEVSVAGAQGLRLLENGTLVLQTPLGEIEQAPPETWTVLPDGGTERVACRYVLRGEDRFGFAAPGWSGELALVVDPKLVWSTYFGGPDDPRYDNANAVHVDANGIVTISGYTDAPSFPGSAGAFQPTYVGGTMDGFVARFDPTAAGGAQLLYSAMIGGTDLDTLRDMSVDANGVITLVGRTRSTDYPVTSGAYDTTHNGGYDVVVTRIDPSQAGSAQVVWSTFVGGTLDDQVAFGALLPSGGVAVAARTDSGDFPTTVGAYDNTPNGGVDCCVFQLDPSGSTLVLSTYLGGSGNDYPYDLAVDSFGMVIVSGQTWSTDYPTTAGAYDTTYNGTTDSDGFITVLDPNLVGLLGSTYLGGPGEESVSDVAVQVGGVITAMGRTNSATFPTTTGVFDPTHNGGYDVFISRVDISCSTLLASTFVGGTADDGGSFFAKGLAVEANGETTFVCATKSADYPTTPDAYDTSFNGSTSYYDMAVTRLDSNLQALLHSTYLGGANAETAYQMHFDPASGHATLAGTTRSSDLPTTATAFAPTVIGGNNEILVSQLDLILDGVRRYGSSTPACAGPELLYVLEEPVAGTSNFGFACTGVPPSTSGLLVLALNDFPAGLPILGITIWVDLASPNIVLSLSSDLSGRALAPMPIPPGTTGARVLVQTLWLNTAGCPGTGLLSCTDALEVIVQ